MDRYILSVIIISAAITFVLRALPFIAFAKRPMPPRLVRLGRVLPPAIMAVLIVYCLKDGISNPLSVGAPSLVAVVATAAAYKLKHNTFAGIIVGTAVYMLLIRIF